MGGKKLKYKKNNKNNYAVSNVLGYLLTFSIVSLLMVAAVLTTNSIVESKNISAGEQIAQSLANQIADSLVDVVSLSQSNPSTFFDHSLDIPSNLAGRRYYIEITAEKTYVNSTDGKISRSCTNYNHDLNLGLHQKIFSDTNKIMFSYTPSNLLYTLDFSKGNSFSHSPVESGSYMITPVIDPLWPEAYENYRYRTPFVIDNTHESAKDIIDATVSVALDSKSIDYSKTNVKFTDSQGNLVSNTFSEPYAQSDLLFVSYKNSVWTALKYSIDYWNENGFSLISLKIPELNKNELLYVFLYYGYTGDIATIYDRSLNDTSEFFYDFSSSLDANVWTASEPGIEITDSSINLSKQQYILSKQYSISSPSSEAMYVIEAKINYLEGDGSVIALSNTDMDYTHSYLVSVDTLDSNKFFMHKQIGDVSDPSNQVLMHEASVSALPSWLRQKTFVYINTSESFTTLSSFLYDYNSYALIPRFVNASDENFGGVSAYDAGRIGFGAGLLLDENDEAKFSIDWVRVVKVAHGYQPSISWGAWETTNFRWNTSSISAAMYNPDDLSEYGALLCDYHFNSIELREDDAYIEEQEEEQEDQEEEQEDTDLRGSGTADDPYQIYNWHHLNEVRNHLSSHFILMNDLDANTAGYDSLASRSADSGRGWLAIGDLSNSFKGTFNGNNYSIIDLYIKRKNDPLNWDDVGLFGVADGAEIKNIILKNAIISGRRRVGSVIGYAIYGSQMQYLVSLNVSIDITERYGGGVIGALWRGSEIYRSYSTGTLKRGNHYHWNSIGGLIGGTTVNTLVDECYSFVNITSLAHNSYGGLVGSMWLGSEVKNSYAQGSVIGSWACAGGLIGEMQNGRNAVRNSYSTGYVYAKERYIGGLLGYKHSGSLCLNSFWDKTTSGQSSSSGGTAKTTNQMMDYNTFNDAGWDIAKIENWNGETWYIDDGNDYPRLGWTMFAGGDGSSENPYQISNWQQLNNIRYNLDQSFVLINDIDSNSYGYDTYASSSANGGLGWNPIGRYSGMFDFDEFTGVFDGDNYTINDLYINRPSNNGVGLFCVVGGSTIINIGLNNIDITGRNQVGGLIGHQFNNSFIANSYTTGIIRGQYYVGGLVGQQSTSLIDNSYSITTVIADFDYVGGLVGYSLTNSIIANCFAAGNVQARNLLGGFAGYQFASTIVNSYSTGSVSGISSGFMGGVGGFIGRQQSSSSILNCYAKGDVTRISGMETLFAGFCAVNDRSSIINSFSTGSVNLWPKNKGFVSSINTGEGYEDRGNFFDKDTSGHTNTTGSAEGKTTEDMKSLSTFLNQGWDIAILDELSEEIWYIDDGNNYPRLFFQKKSLPIVETNNATQITETTATLWGTLIDDSGEACAVGFDYGTTQEYGMITADQLKRTDEIFSQQIIILNPGQIYHYRSFAENSEQRSTGENKVFLTHPNRPTNVNGQINSPTSITLQWIKGTGAHTTRIQRSTGSYPTTINDGVTIYNGTATSYTDSGLIEGTIYYYSLWSYTQCDTTLLYQYSRSHARIKTGNPTQAQSAELLIKNIPQGTYTIQITKGDHQTQNDEMTILCNYATENPILYFSDCSRGSFQTKQFRINKNTDDDISILFQGNQGNSDFFTVHYIKIYAGEQTLRIKEQ